MVIALDESRPVGGHKAVVKVADNIISPSGNDHGRELCRSQGRKVGTEALRILKEPPGTILRLSDR